VRLKPCMAMLLKCRLPFACRLRSKTRWPALTEGAPSTSHKQTEQFRSVRQFTIEIKYEPHRAQAERLGLADRERRSVDVLSLKSICVAGRMRVP
jgi:hypothetical protein